jgi:hypothetical protein
MVLAHRSTEQSVVVKGVVPKSLKLQFNVLCTKQELKMSEAIEELIEKWIQADGPKFTTDWSDEDLVEVKGYIPRSLKRQFKVLCARKLSFYTFSSVFRH